MSKLAVIIGGTFAPITKAHIYMGKTILKNMPYADVWYIPTNLDFIKKWKKIEGVDKFFYDNRIDMIERTLQNEFHLNNQVFYSEIEASGYLDGSTWATYNFIKKYNYDEVYVVVGADKIAEIPEWQHGDELMKHLVVFTRRDIPLPANQVTFFMPDEYKNISSTQARDYFNRGDLNTLKEIVPTTIYCYCTGELQRRGY